MKKVFSLDFRGKKLVVEIGEMAKQADGACLVRLDESAVLSTACISDSPKEMDYFPLMVIYEEKQYAAGKIPGGFFRREGKATEHATLTGRLIDRPIRPMFSEGFRNEVQLINTVLSADYDASPEMSAMFGSSLALGISDAPFDGPIAGVYVGLVDGKYVINPTVEEKQRSKINITVAGTKDAINMVEGGAAEVSEKVLLEALMFGHEAVRELCLFQEKIIKEVGKPKREIPVYTLDEKLKEELHALCHKELVEAISTFDKLERDRNIQAVQGSAIEAMAAREYESDGVKAKTMKQVREILELMVANEVRRLITEEKIRPDGRRVDEIRPLDAQIDLLPRVHGSAMFTRGQTQVLSICTLGSLSDAQMIDNLTEEESKRFIHHYNFPPFSVGDIGRMAGPKGREIGHGALVERALSYAIPSEDEFPYAIRMVSETLESNGSSSQASVCASSMALMAAGVPISGMLSGIAMGLVTSGPLDGKHPYTILTDIQGMEDHFGDMDFKVAGTKKGVTAIQMDIKIKGVSREILEEALEQANVARTYIREFMEQTISKPRPDVGKYAPKMTTFNIDPDKIRAVIGTGGKVINDIIARCDNVKIDIEDTGRVTIYHMDRETINKAKTIIEDIVRVAKVGEDYTGKVTRVEEYGAFVNLFGDTDGLCHVSRLGWGFIKSAHDVVKVGDTLKVRVIELEENGKVKVSHREFEPKPEGYVEPERKERKPSSGGGRPPFNKGKKR